MIFGKYINRYYLKNAPALLLGLLSLLIVDIAQLMIPELYRLVINGVNLGKVVVDGQTLTFTREVLFQNICLPMIWIVLMMVIGRFLWRVCFFGSAVFVSFTPLSLPANKKVLISVVTPLLKKKKQMVENRGRKIQETTIRNR